MKYKILNRTMLSHGFLTLQSIDLTHEKFDGGQLHIRREVMERGDAVAVLLYDPIYDETLLIEQFRIGPVLRDDNPWLIEVVAGMIDKGEDSEVAVRREAIEEAGYAPADLKYLGHYYATPGGSSEVIDLYLGYVDKDHPVNDGGGVEHEHEDIRRFWVSRKEAMLMARDGRINSGAPMLAVLLAFGVDAEIKR